ncbi:MAG: DJ-1/PfpI family protein [Actinomycetota bacterium]
MALRIGVFVFEGAEELDWAGPWQVLSFWARHWPDDGVEVFTFAPEAGAVRCAEGLTLLPDHTLESAPPFDVLVYPGGSGVGKHLGNDEIRSWLRRLADSGVLLTSVCTGSLAYADAGLLDGRAATCHWASLGHLASLGSGIEVRAGQRFVDTGPVVTAAGVSAGIDMALHLIARLHSVERARAVKRAIEYEPLPPV